MCCQAFKRGSTKLERFLLKNQHTQRTFLNFENWSNGELSKIGHHFNNKVISKLMLSKNVLLYWYSSMKKKNRMIFDIEIWLWKSNFGTFWYLQITLIHKILQFPLGMLTFSQKAFSLENSITGIAILQGVQYQLQPWSGECFQHVVRL